jgi:hypothetical protein
MVVAEVAVAVQLQGIKALVQVARVAVETEKPTRSATTVQ